MKSIKYILVLLLMAGVFTSCEKFLDINDDPNNPTEASILQLMPSAQLAIAFQFSNIANRVGEDAVQHLVVQRFDAWAVDGSDLSNDWRFNLYAGALKDLEDIIEQSTESEDFHYAGISKLLKAYSYSLMVDMWDDIPYSQACREFEYPLFDDAADIYDDLFSLIDDGIADLAKGNEAPLDQADLIYGGDIESWVRMGNTLKLKLYNQIRLIDADRAKTGIENLVAAENANPGTVLITSADQDFSFNYVNNANPENRHPGFQNDYMVKGEAYISNFFYDLMDGNSDPRIPYYFYNQGEDGFEGRDYGDPGPIGNDNGSRTVQGIYPVGGKFEDGSATSVTGSSAPGNGEFRMITNVMRLFIETEAALTLNATVSGNADDLFQSAMEEAFAEVNRLDAPNISTDDISAYVQQQMQNFADSVTTESKLNLVMTEKYVAMFGNGLEAFNDYRRTGYPVIPDPIETNQLRLLRFPYPDDELTANPNAPAQPNRNVPVFWDVNEK